MFWNRTLVTLVFGIFDHSLLLSAFARDENNFFRSFTKQISQLTAEKWEPCESYSMSQPILNPSSQLLSYFSIIRTTTKVDDGPNEIVYWKTKFRHWLLLTLKLNSLGLWRPRVKSKCVSWFRDVKEYMVGFKRNNFDKRMV